MHSQTAPRTRGRSGSPPTYIFVSEDSDLKNSQSSSECNYQSRDQVPVSRRSPISRTQSWLPTERTRLRSTERKVQNRNYTIYAFVLFIIVALLWSITLVAVLSNKSRNPSKDSSSRVPVSGVYWDNVHPRLNCASYGTRQYSARLMNIPSFSNGLQVCKKIPVKIHNTTISSPNRCENQGFWGGIHGFWVVDFEEKACMPIWGDFTDEGCIAEGSRLRRTESRLWNIQHTDDWMQMCTTTPARIHGLDFLGPKECVNRGPWGIYGMWEYEDLSC